MIRSTALFRRSAPTLGRSTHQRGDLDLQEMRGQKLSLHGGYNLGTAYWDNDFYKATAPAVYTPRAPLDGIYSQSLWRVVTVGRCEHSHGTSARFSLPCWDHADGTPAPLHPLQYTESTRRIEWNKRVLTAVLKAELALARGSLPEVGLNHERRRQGFVPRYVDLTGKVRDAAGDVVGDFAADTLGFTNKSTERYLRATRRQFTGAVRGVDYAAFSREAPRDGTSFLGRGPGGASWWQSPTADATRKLGQERFGSHVDDPVVLRMADGEPILGAKEKAAAHPES